MTEYLLKHQLTAGFPGTGKTTFLAALWHVLESDEIATGLRLKKVQDERQYLNQIRGKWVNCFPVDRTTQGTEELQISLLLELADGSAATKLVVPDMAGESYANLWENRKWDGKYDEVARAAKGMLLFIHPNEIKKRHRIRDISFPLDEAENHADKDNPSMAVPIKPWEPKHSPTAVQLVELLQFFTYDPSCYPLDRVALIISAWDLVMEEVLPSEWLTREMPLLDQFLKSNSDRLSYRIYGLSAQNGDISIPEKADELRRYPNPSERILVVTDEGKLNDITAPLKWLMEL